MIKCNLSRILGERRITRVRLSKQTGISLFTLAQLYHDKWHGVNRDTINTVCKALAIQVGDLFEYVEEPKLGKGKR
jgi:putative transcriptional regulator